MFFTIIVILVIVMLATGSFYIVPQQKSFIIERLGKYKGYETAGFHVKVPFIDRIAARMSLRIEQLDVSLETKTLDNVFVNVVASTQYRVDENNVSTAYYQLSDPGQQLQAYMEDALRSAIPKLTLDDAFAKKDDVALDVQETVGAEMKRFGFDVVKTLITAIDPSPSVKKAMDSINAAQREKEATRERAEAKRIEIETQATAEAEKTRLQGQGQANYRREIAEGIVDQIRSLQAVGMDIDSVNQIVMFNQYLDVMRGLSESTNTKTVVLPTSTPGGFRQLDEEITRAIITGNEATKDDAK